MYKYLENYYKLQNVVKKYVQFCVTLSTFKKI